ANSRHITNQKRSNSVVDATHTADVKRKRVGKEGGQHGKTGDHERTLAPGSQPRSRHFGHGLHRYQPATRSPRSPPGHSDSLMTTASPTRSAYRAWYSWVLPKSRDATRTRSSVKKVTR